MDLGDVGQADARVAKFTFHDGFNLLAQGLGQALPMIFLPPVLHVISSK
jgi:hypothetical protein